MVSLRNSLASGKSGGVARMEPAYNQYDRRKCYRSESGHNVFFALSQSSFCHPNVVFISAVMWSTGNIFEGASVLDGQRVLLLRLPSISLVLHSSQR